MNRRLFQFAILLLWLALPLTALQYRGAWDQLPAQMATHFNAANQPNGWMPREASLKFSLRLIAIMLIVTSLVLVATTWRKVTALSWALLGFFALFLGFLLAVNQAVLNFNLHQAPVHPQRMLVALAVAAVALIAFYFLSRREAPLPKSEMLVVETHSGGAWAALILLAVLGPLLAISLAPGGVRWPVYFAGIAGVAVFAMAWSGFHYRFMQHGLEISALGFRLRSIPRSAILSYSIEPWSLIRGYGIRGYGSTRAYVWCNKVVHIKTSHGDVYLGHNDPERIVRDLDQMMGVVTRG